MATDDGGAIAEAPLSLPADAFAAAAAAAAAAEAGLAKSSSNKRPRETTPSSPDSIDGLSPAKIARLVRFTHESTTPLTGAAAFEDERRAREEEQRLAAAGAISDNPSHRVLTELMTGVEAMSRPHDVSADGASKGLNPVVTIPTGGTAASPDNVSPDSTTSVGVPSLGDGAGGGVVDSPVPMDVDGRQEQRMYAPQPDAQMDDKTATSLSYPGILPSGSAGQHGPPRGMSMPMPNSELAPRSPLSKKHKCPYCDTEFTRHHNLKSHLLTHSQEKPYVCQTCQMRFRRLHDLKRHSKLHTGEKPHICPKCDRKFARGDALARHSKGSGGCAGRRTSMGSFAGDDDYDASAAEGDDSAMGGMYDGADADMTEEERRRLSLPTIKAPHVAAQVADGYASHASTYPPAGRSSTGGGLLPPDVNRGTSSSNTSPSMPNSTGGGHTPHTSVSSMPMSAGNSSVFSQGGVAESPKPLSPAGAQTHGSTHPQFRAEQGASQPSHGTSVMSAAAQQAWLSRYPPADGKSTEGGAASSSSSATKGPRARMAQGSAAAVAAGAANPNGNPATGSVDNTNNLFAAGEQGVWAYVQHLDSKINQMQAEVEAGKRAQSELRELREKFVAAEAQIAELTSEVASLRQEMAGSPGPASS